MKKSLPIFGVVLVFLLGILCGSLAMHLFYKYRMDSIISGRGETREEALVNRLSRELKLDDHQEELVRSVIHETHNEIKGLRSQIHPQIQVVIEKAQERINTILKPDQREIYMQMIAKHKEKLRKKEN